MAWCKFGSKGTCERFDFFALMAFQNALQLPADHFESFEQACRVGRFFRMFDRPLDVVEHGQQIAQNSHVGILQPIFQLPRRPLPIVVQLGLQAQRAVLGLLQFGAELLGGIVDRNRDGRLFLRLRRFRLSLFSVRGDDVYGSCGFLHNALLSRKRLRPNPLSLLYPSENTLSLYRKSSSAWAKRGCFRCRPTGGAFLRAAA